MMQDQDQQKPMAPEPKQPTQQGQGQGQGQSQGGFPPEAKRLAEQIYLHAAEIIHGQAADAVLKRLSSGDPVQALATVAAEVVKASQRASEQATGQEVPGSSLQAAGIMVVNDLTYLMIKAGIIQEEQAGEIASAAFVEAVKIYLQRSAQAGEITPQHIQEAQRTLQEYQQQGGQVQAGARGLLAGRGPGQQAAGGMAG